MRADSLAKLMDSIDGFSEGHYGWYYKPAYASSGPEICYFTAENWGTSDQAIPGNDRFRLQMLVRSEKGLAEVQLYDRGTLVRRFLLDGAKEFKRTLDEYHSQQHSFILVAVDSGGWQGHFLGTQHVRAGMLVRHVRRQHERHGTGRQNHARLGTGISLGGTECAVTPLGPGVHLAVAQSASPAGRRNGRAESRLSRRHEGLLAGEPLRHGSELSAGLLLRRPGNVGGVYPAPLKINPFFDGTYRCYNFARRPPGPNLEIRDYTLTIKQDVELTAHAGRRPDAGRQLASAGRTARSPRLLHSRGQPGRRIADRGERTAVLQSDR